MSREYETRLNKIVDSIEILTNRFKLKHDCDDIFDAIDKLYKKTPRSRDADDTVLTEIEHEISFLMAKIETDSTSGLCYTYFEWILACPIYKNTFEFVINSQNVVDVLTIYKKEQEITNSPVPLGVDSPYKCSGCGANALPVEVQNRSLDEGPGFKYVCVANCKYQKSR